MNLDEAPSSPPRPAVYLIKHVQMELRKVLDEALAEIDLNSSHVAILSVLFSRPSLCNADLARAAFVTPQTMIPLLGNLERRKLIRRISHPKGGRALLATLTPAGTRKLREGWAAVQVAENRMLKELTSEDRIRFRSFLEVCLASLRAAR
jgi:DNA-binding MarR family transcriptional regulator